MGYSPRLLPHVATLPLSHLVLPHVTVNAGFTANYPLYTAYRTTDHVLHVMTHQPCNVVIWAIGLGLVAKDIKAFRPSWLS